MSRSSNGSNRDDRSDKEVKKGDIPAGSTLFRPESSSNFIEKGEPRHFPAGSSLFRPEPSSNPLKKTSRSTFRPDSPTFRPVNSLPFSEIVIYRTFRPETPLSGRNVLVAISEKQTTLLSGRQLHYPAGKSLISLLGVFLETGGVYKGFLGE